MNREQLIKFGLIAGGGVAALGAVIGVIAFMEDQDANIREFGITDPQSSCVSPEEGHEYFADYGQTARRLRDAVTAASSLSEGPVGQEVLSILNSGRPFCFTDRYSDVQLEAPVVKGGTFKPFWVVDGDMSSGWLASYFASQSIDDAADDYTRRSNEYVTRSAVLWERLRYAVPETYRLYANYLIADDQSYSDPFGTDTWQSLDANTRLSEAADVFEARISEGDTAQQAWFASLQTYMADASLHNANDVDFLRWYADEVGEQETRIHYEITCFDNGPDIDIETTLPEKVSFSDVWSFSVRNDADWECDRLIEAEESRVEREKDSLRSDIASLWSDINRLDEELGRMPTEDPDFASKSSSLSSMQSRVSSLETQLKSIHPERQSYSDSVLIQHEPSEVVHSMTFNAGTLSDYIATLTGPAGIMTEEQAAQIANDDRNTELGSQTAEDLYDRAERNADRYADNYRYGNDIHSRGLGLR